MNFLINLLLLSVFIFLRFFFVVDKLFLFFLEELKITKLFIDESLGKVLRGKYGRELKNYERNF